MTSEAIRQARVKTQLRTMKREERERAALACSQIGYDLLQENPDAQGMSMQDACELCADAIRAMNDEL